jgi:UDP-N-acetylmuramate dehydrogenase
MSGFASLVDEGLVTEHVPLGPLTTYRFGGPARWYAEVGSATDLERVLAARRAAGVDLLVLGRGSNLLVADSGYPGVVVRLGGGLAVVSIGTDGIVAAGGAVPLPMLARHAAKAGRGGLEWYIGIPGSVGGALRMNAGGHGSDTGEWLLDAEVMDAGTGAITTRDVAGLDLSYRHSNLTDTDIVLSARYRSIARDPAEAEALIREITRWRREHQPGGTLNAGSVFKNPPGDAAGRIIDAVGLKGYRRGGASVSERHANFFVAEAGACAQDIYDLVWAVRRRVGEAVGVWLEPEIRFAGDFAANDDVCQPQEAK